MIFNPKKHKIFFYNNFIDMRKGHSSLTMLITEKTNFEVMDGSLFLFVSKNKKTIKGVFFDGSGLVLLHKKIEAGKFMSFNVATAMFEVNRDEFKIIFHGGQIPLSRTGKRIKFKKNKIF
ncbi:MAG: IS66 family insertion sequence element accessory protein TnpB [Oligoflexia bacterium]|nr:IS66 family insertion sequence element accessory protein TnpB [Oligoflexia bacterium]